MAGTRYRRLQPMDTGLIRNPVKFIPCIGDSNGCSRCDGGEAQGTNVIQPGRVQAEGLTVDVGLRQGRACCVQCEPLLLLQL
jgi:hypothetical protein